MSLRIHLLLPTVLQVLDFFLIFTQNTLLVLTSTIPYTIIETCYKKSKSLHRRIHHKAELHSGTKSVLFFSLLIKIELSKHTKN